VVPTSGHEVSVETAKTLIGAQAARGASVQYQISVLSLLARNFNYLFCQAYSAGFDYLIYVHSDLGIESAPGQHWVDTVIAVMEEKKFAAVSQVIPIKNDSGTTTTALQLNKNNKYGLRRLTVKEVAGHTGIITREDLCRMFSVSPDDAGALLINTGLLCLGLKNFYWPKWDGFSIEDKILWNKSGTPKAFTTSEDWRFSMWLHEKEWPYGAINCFAINHDGHKYYSNREVWGGEHDATNVEVSEEKFVASVDGDKDEIKNG